MTRGFTHTLWIDTWFHTPPIWPTSWFHTHPHIYVLTLLTFKGRTSITTDPLKGVETEPPKARTALRVSSGLRPRHKASPNILFSQRQKTGQPKAKQPYRFATCLRHKHPACAMPLKRMETARQQVFAGWARGVVLGYSQAALRGQKPMDGRNGGARRKKARSGRAWVAGLSRPSLRNVCL